jgi:predicted alpha/beta hydrolase family esterase
MAWRFASASAAGTSHTHTGAPCQDYHLCVEHPAPTGETVLIAVAADGAGSASHAQEGAKRACNRFYDDIAALFNHGGQLADITQEFLADWLARFQNAIREHAEQKELTTRDFACTVLAAVLTEHGSVFFQVGDGAIVVASPDAPDDYRCVFWPDKGEYANVTTFATQEEAIEQFHYDYCVEPVCEVAVLTDGLERLALHFQSRSAHAPFFRAMFVLTRKQEKHGRSQEMSERLQTFLCSPQVNGRTDDDKTLILASRYLETQAISSNQ